MAVSHTPSRCGGAYCARKHSSLKYGAETANRMWHLHTQHMLHSLMRGLALLALWPPRTLQLDSFVSYAHWPMLTGVKRHTTVCGCVIHHCLSVSYRGSSLQMMSHAHTPCRANTKVISCLLQQLARAAMLTVCTAHACFLPESTKLYYITAGTLARIACACPCTPSLNCRNRYIAPIATYRTLARTQRRTPAMVSRACCAMLLPLTPPPPSPTPQK
jgi:hypothetical protein